MTTRPSGHISYLQIWAFEGIFSFNVSLVKLFTLVYRYTLLFNNQLVKINGFVDLKSSWLCCAICFVVVFFSYLRSLLCHSSQTKKKKTNITTLEEARKSPKQKTVSVDGTIAKIIHNHCLRHKKLSVIWRTLWCKCEGGQRHISDDLRQVLSTLT